MQMAPQYSCIPIGHQHEHYDCHDGELVSEITEHSETLLVPAQYLVRPADNVIDIKSYGLA